MSTIPTSITKEQFESHISPHFYTGSTPDVSGSIADSPLLQIDNLVLTQKLSKIC